MSECEIPDFYNFSEPVAKKQHACCECHGKIQVGERHFKAIGKWDGVLSTYRQHYLCEEACEYIRDHLNGYECIGFGELFEWVSENGLDKTDSQVKYLRSLLAKIKLRKRTQR